MDSTVIDMDLTPTQRLAGFVLDEPLAAFVARGRAAGKSWRVLARDLYSVTDGEIDVTENTLRAWHQPTEDTAVAS